jgi:hypothetical protein
MTKLGRMRNDHTSEWFLEQNTDAQEQEGAPYKHAGNSFGDLAGCTHDLTLDTCSHDFFFRSPFAINKRLCPKAFMTAIVSSHMSGVKYWKGGKVWE